MLRFFETLPHFDFDLSDSDGESPLFYAIVKKNLEMVKFFVAKGADLNRRSATNKWSVVYIAATLGNTETLEYLISLGCDVNF
jgi:ankyrin repeat protein